MCIKTKQKKEGKIEDNTYHGMMNSENKFCSRKCLLHADKDNGACGILSVKETRRIEENRHPATVLLRTLTLPQTEKC